MLVKCSRNWDFGPHEEIGESLRDNNHEVIHSLGINRRAEGGITKGLWCLGVPGFSPIYHLGVRPRRDKEDWFQTTLCIWLLRGC